MKHYGDIRTLNGKDLPPVSCITGGSPCQNLSIAGNRTGLDGEQSRLFLEQIRIVKEMRQATNDKFPRFMVWENVPGAFSSNKGEDFRTVLNEIVGISEEHYPDVPKPSKGWTKSGCLYNEVGSWSVAWRLHDAQFWGVPQRRKRIALVADFRGRTAPEILFEPKSLSWDINKSEEKRESAAEEVGKCFGSASTVSNVVFDARGNGSGSVIPTITGDHQNRITDYTAICVGNGQLNQFLMSEKLGALNTMHDQQAVLQNDVVRRLTPLECERAQGFPDRWTDVGDWVDHRGRVRKSSDTARYKALGNSIATPFWMWLLGRISDQCELPATLGSLFDGIGGFPYCWELHNGPGSAVWASEIEEFPIAVTKKRFPEQDNT